MPTARRDSPRSAIDWQERRRDIADNALPLFLSRPWPNVSIEEIGAECDMSFWQVYYSFDGLEDVYRAAIMRLFENLSEEFAAQPEPAATIQQTISDFVDHVAAIVQSPRYRQLLYLRVRDERIEPWLGIQHEKRIVRPLIIALGTAIETSGHRMGMEIAVDEQCCRRTLASLEANLSLPRLLQDDGLDEDFCQQAIRSSSKKLWAGTFHMDESLPIAV
ncbi:TetR/AcrR family transcriptional regulator [Parasphingopyxis sp. CP4]|uniref:TetR/AcrR family transcriptional regulator n=1 Tax=Parasphingopyxis sp. CP4 TaxID=2724527 RepID=UPI0015A404C1|nr:TetR/AcrR family transcriptional regulator [Parasphingopyxis sp. CP4]QLC23039.1 TetR/AcrR family transcriptional regulator [Parasphingopyxis sp. CP4]